MIGAPEVVAFLAAPAGNPDRPPAAEAGARAALAFPSEVVLGRPPGDLCMPARVKPSGRSSGVANQ
jgi:hypothetical protein